MRSSWRRSRSGRGAIRSCSYLSPSSQRAHRLYVQTVPPADPPMTLSAIEGLLRRIDDPLVIRRYGLWYLSRHRVTGLKVRENGFTTESVWSDLEHSFSLLYPSTRRTQRKRSLKPFEQSMRELLTSCLRIWSCSRRHRCVIYFLVLCPAASEMSQRTLACRPVLCSATSIKSSSSQGRATASQC